MLEIEVCVGKQSNAYFFMPTFTLRIKDPSYVKYALANILIIIMYYVLRGLDTLEDLAVYEKSKEDFLRETFEIKKVPSKATFGQILSMVNGKQIWSSYSGYAA